MLLNELRHRLDYPGLSDSVTSPRVNLILLDCPFPLSLSNTFIKWLWSLSYLLMQPMSRKSIRYQISWNSNLQRPLLNLFALFSICSVSYDTWPDIHPFETYSSVYSRECSPSFLRLLSHHQSGNAPGLAVKMDNDEVPLSHTEIPAPLCFGVLCPM